MRKPDNKLLGLDSAIEIERRAIERLQANCQQVREEVRQAEQAQERAAYPALVDGDAQAKAALAEAEETLSKAHARARSSDIALKAAMTKLEGLQNERREMFMEQKRREYAAMAVELIRTNGEELESNLEQMSASREAIYGKLKAMDQVAIDAGIDPARVHSRIKETLRHAIEQRAQFQSAWMSKQTREVFKGPIPTLLQQTLKGIVNQLETGENGRRIE